MGIPEFLLLNNPQGDIEVMVDFKKEGNFKPHVASIHIKYTDIINFFDTQTGWLFNEMTFDEHPYRINKIIMDIKKNCIIIKTD